MNLRVYTAFNLQNNFMIYSDADYSVASDKTSYTNDSYLEMDKETISRCFFGRETQI